MSDARVWVCPYCGGDAYLCCKSDHGVVNGRALHCRDFVSHNEFDVDEFGRWEPAGNDHSVISDE